MSMPHPPPRRRFQRRRVVGWALLLIAFVVTFHWYRNRLNETERRLVGRWTVETLFQSGKPGECVFNSDRTIRGGRWTRYSRTWRATDERVYLGRRLPFSLRSWTALKGWFDDVLSGDRDETDYPLFLFNNDAFELRDGNDILRFRRIPSAP